MFGIGGWEFILIAGLALLLFGPDKLPQFARTIGKFMREFKRYQDLMQATVRAEMFNADPTLRKDAFEAAKEARKRTGAGGGFTTPETAEESAGEETPAEQASEETPAAGTPEETPAEQASEETPVDAMSAAEAATDPSADGVEVAEAPEPFAPELELPPSDEGEGEQGEA